MTGLMFGVFGEDARERRAHRWVDLPAVLSNAQVLELKRALDEQVVLIAELAADGLAFRQRLAAVEHTVDDFDRSVGMLDDRLDRVELVLDGEASPAPLGPAEIAIIDRMAEALIDPLGVLAVAGCPPGAAGGPGAGPDFETYRSLHELSEALGRVYRSAGIETWEQAVAVFRVGWELGTPEADRVDMATIWNWLQARTGR